jgi:hypothetical protein
MRKAAGNKEQAEARLIPLIAGQVLWLPRRMAMAG